MLLAASFVLVAVEVLEELLALALQLGGDLRVGEVGSFFSPAGSEVGGFSLLQGRSPARVREH